MNDISDQKLDDLLRCAFTGAVEDGGFSARVIRALPARARQRSWLLPGAALAGGLLAWLALLPSALLKQVVSEWLAGGFGAASAGVCGVLFGISALGCSWALDES